MRRTYELFGLSFLDILIAALGSFVFMFIVVDKGGGLPDSAETGAFPRVYLNADTAQGLFYGLERYDTLSIKAGKPALVIVNKVQPMQKDPCPVMECDCDEAPVCPDPAHHRRKACPDPAHHKKEPCPDPSCHNPQRPVKVNEPLVCSRLHCEDAACSNQPRVVYKGDPVEIPYKIGFSISDTESITRDVDLKVCHGNVCVSSLRKNQGWIRWIDLNKTNIFRPGIVTGGEVVIVDKLVTGNYKIYAKYDKGKKAGEPGSTNTELTVATKQNGKIRHLSEAVKLDIDTGWKLISTVSVDAKGIITNLN